MVLKRASEGTRATHPVQDDVGSGTRVFALVHTREVSHGTAQEGNKRRFDYELTLMLIPGLPCHPVSKRSWATQEHDVSMDVHTVQGLVPKPARWPRQSEPAKPDSLPSGMGSKADGSNRPFSRDSGWGPIPSFFPKEQCRAMSTSLTLAYLTWRFTRAGKGPDWWHSIKTALSI